MENPTKRPPRSPSRQTSTDADGHDRELELALARERDAAEQVRLLERRLVEAERAAARAAELQHELDAAVASHGLQAAALRREIEQLRHALQGLEGANARLHQENRELEATAVHFRAVNEGLMNSLSWRITRPLRALKTLRG